jgi:hypothetical protein
MDPPRGGQRPSSPTTSTVSPRTSPHDRWFIPWVSARGGRADWAAAERDYASRFHGALRPSSPPPPCQGRSGSRAEMVPLHGSYEYVMDDRTSLRVAIKPPKKKPAASKSRRHVRVRVRRVHARGDLAPPAIPSNGAQVAAAGRREHGEARQGQLLRVEDLDGAAVQEGSRRREARSVVPVAGERQGRGTCMRGAWRFPRSKLLVGDSVPHIAGGDCRGWVGIAEFAAGTAAGEVGRRRPSIVLS